MTPDMLQTELDRAEDAELQSDEQLRQLTDLLDKTCGPNPTMNANDCAKVVAAALALNNQLRARTERLKNDIAAEERKVKAAAEKVKSDAFIAASYRRAAALPSAK